MTDLEQILQYADQYKKVVEVEKPSDELIKTYENRIKELEQIIQELTEKKSKPSKPMYLKSLESIFKGFENKKNPNGYWLFGIDGYRYACDGFRIIKTSEPIDINSNVVVNDIEKYVPAEWSNRFSKMIDDIKDADTEQFELPSYEVLNELFKKAKQPKTSRYLYTLKTEKGLVVGFNAKFLLDSMKATGSNLIQITTPKSPAIMISEDGKTESLILPINVTNNKPDNIGRVVAI